MISNPNSNYKNSYFLTENDKCNNNNKKNHSKKNVSFHRQAPHYSTERAVNTFHMNCFLSRKYFQLKCYFSML